ncbi:HAMP domain-containing histidine kinase [bacterium]|nr:HAMP domain-containing histidine kinase [bacterium]
MGVSYYYLDPVDAVPGEAKSHEAELLRVAIALNEGGTPEQVVDILFETLDSLVPFDRIGLAVLDDNGVLHSRHVRSKRPILWGPGERGVLSGSSLAPILQERKLRIINDLEAYAREHPASYSTTLLVQEGMRASLTLPLSSRRRPIGVLFFTSTQPHAYTAEQVPFLSGLAIALGLALERSEILAELQAANARLKSLDELKTNFLSNLSHELRTPLSQVLGFSYALEDETQGALSPTQHETLAQIIAGAERLSGLLHDLFDFTALQSGLLSLEKVPIDLDELLTELVAEASPAITEAGLTLSLDLEGHDLALEGDPPRLAQVFQALLDNARKFTPSPGRIEVVAGRSDAQVWVEVRDTGIGIAPEAQAQIFEKFSPLDSGPARRYPGAGLGLPLSRAIVEAHGGTITLKSELGKGTTFRVTLPSSFL